MAVTLRLLVLLLVSMTAASGQVAPTFTTQPISQTGTIGGNVTFTVAATGTAPLAYRWFKDGIEVAGATGSSLTISGVKLSDGGSYQATVSNSTNQIKAVSARSASTMFIQTDGTLWTIGGDSFDSASQRYTPVQVATGAASVSGLVHVKTDGTLWAMGGNRYGNLGDGTTTDRSTPVQVATGVASVSAGETHTLYVKTDGTLWAMGWNVYGQLGDGTTTQRNTPVQVATGVASVSAGSTHTLFVKTDGTLWATGYNGSGQLGDGTTTNRSTPVQVATGVASASAGSLFVKTDGTLWAMGSNDYGRLGDGTTTNRYTPVQVATGVASVSAGGVHTLFVKTDGTLWAMGLNLQGQLGDGTTTNRSAPVQVATGVASASGGSFHTVFVKTDGTLWAMGDNSYGQLGDDTRTQRNTPVRIAREVFSNAATLTLPPAITTQPSNSSVTAGSAASFSVAASGTAPLTYQWRKDGVAISGATSSTYSISSTLAGASGSYTVIVTNSVGSVTSSAAVLTVNIAPSITTQPSASTVTAGGAVSFSVAASGTAPFTYQWRKDGAAISGATSSTYSISSTSAVDAGRYTVVVTNGVGSVASSVAVLTVNIAPSITTQPSASTVTLGSAASFSVAASGTATLTYQWRKDGAAISGATSSTYSISSAVTSDAGSYTVVVTNSAGSATSNAATLTVTAAATAPTITTQPSSSSVTAGSAASFSVAASGTATLTYQWRKDGTAISGATSSTYSISSAATSDAGSYTVVVTNSAGSATSNAATLTVTAAATAPTITTQPSSSSVTAGSAASFSVAASGTAPLTYQWRKDGTAISGATSSTYSISSAATSDAGSYTVVVTNSVGSATSNAATLTVTAAATAPTITTQPSSSSVTAGSAASFSVAASGTAPLTYQWRKDGTAISGATSSTYSISSTSTSDAGSYTVVVTNSAGSATSNAATLTVTAAATAPTITTQPSSSSVTSGNAASFSVAASGTATLTYQWRKDGTAISGATSSTYSIGSAAANDAGSYTVVVTNSVGSATSNAATLTVTAAATAPRLYSLAVRTALEANQVLIVGFTMSGGAKNVLLRAAGPTLGAFGVPGTMADPKLDLYSGSTLITSNDNWGGSPSLAATFASAGAFAYASATSLDAALVSSINGGRTAHVYGPAAGAVLVEGYDVGSGDAQKFTSLSARNRVGTGANILIAGFSILGEGKRNLLIRAVGPTLGLFGVPSVLSDPKLEIYQGSTKIGENDNWAATLSTTFSSVGAFGLTQGSKDAAITVSLPAGGYTVQVSGADGGVGEALVEIYELP